MDTKTARIAALNDELRQHLLGGLTVMTADSDEVAQAFRDDVARCSDMMSPGVRCLAG